MILKYNKGGWNCKKKKTILKTIQNKINRRVVVKCCKCKHGN
jgi:hypothetical protein